MIPLNRGADEHQYPFCQGMRETSRQKKANEGKGISAEVRQLSQSRWAYRRTPVRLSPSVKSYFPSENFSGIYSGIYTLIFKRTG